MQRAYLISAPSIKIYESHRFNNSVKQREILEHIIATPEAQNIGLSENDIGYYLDEWAIHNVSYKYPKWAAKYLGLSIEEVKKKATDVD